MVARNRDAELMARGRRGRLFESRAKKAAEECGLDWRTANRFRKENWGEIYGLMTSGFSGAPAATIKALRESLKAKAIAAGIDWNNFLAFLEKLGPIIASFMAMCGI